MIAANERRGYSGVYHHHHPPCTTIIVWRGGGDGGGGGVMASIVMMLLVMVTMTSLSSCCAFNTTTNNTNSDYITSYNNISLKSSGTNTIIENTKHRGVKHYPLWYYPPRGIAPNFTAITTTTTTPAKAATSTLHSRPTAVAGVLEVLDGRAAYPWEITSFRGYERLEGTTRRILLQNKAPSVRKGSGSNGYYNSGNDRLYLRNKRSANSKNDSNASVNDSNASVNDSNASVNDSNTSVNDSNASVNDSSNNVNNDSNTSVNNDSDTSVNNDRRDFSSSSVSRQSTVSVSTIREYPDICYKVMTFVIEIACVLGFRSKLRLLLSLGFVVMVVGWS